MKKSKVVALATVATLMAVSCEKDQQATSGPKFQVTVEQMGAEDEGAKTLFDPVDRYFYWKSSDKLMVYDADFRNIVYKDSLADGNYDYATRTFSGHTNFLSFVPSYEAADYTGFNRIDEESSCYYAFYPSYYVTRVDNQFVYTIPAKTLIDNDKNVDKIDQMHLTRFPMARMTSSHAFNMKSLCGGLKLNLTATGVSVKSIKFVALGNQQVTGAFNVTFSTMEGEDGMPALVPTVVNSETRAITLEMNQPVSIDGGHLFYIPLPPASYEGYEIIITDAQNRTAKLHSSNTLTINRNMIKTIRCTNATFTGTRAFKDAHGKFSISGTQQVYIAPGNLQWYNGNWQFANEQFDVMTLGCNAVYQPDDYNADLFRFSLEKANVYKPFNQWQTFYENNADSIKYTGINNDYGKSRDEELYTTHEELGTHYVSSAVYRDWGLAFGESSDWFVLSKNEFQYLIEQRQNSKCHCQVGNTYNASYSRIIVQDEYGVEHPGLLLFPDNWENDYTNASVAAAINAAIGTNWKSGWAVNSFGNAWSDFNMIMPMSVYRILEEAGCAFLPAAGYVKPTYSNGGKLEGLCIDRGTNNQGTYDGRCYYWTRDYVTNYPDTEYGIDQTAYVFSVENWNFQYQEWVKNTLCSVRLFKPANFSLTR